MGEKTLVLTGFLNEPRSMEFKPLSGRQFPRFSAIKTFFRMPIAEVTDDFDIAMFGAPFDGAVSYRPGARICPDSGS